MLTTHYQNPRFDGQVLSHVLRKSWLSHLHKLCQKVTSVLRLAIVFRMENDVGRSDIVLITSITTLTEKVVNLLPS